MNSESRARVEAWLQYFDDLNISSFYLDRFSAPTAPENPPPGEPRPKPDTIFAMKTPAKDFNSLAQAAPLAAALPVVKSASLFESSDRIENDTLERIREDIGDCKRCKLCEQRTNIVFGSGSGKAELVFIGEGPGHDEDVQGLPFVGRAGKLLTQMIEAMGLRRDEVYICNVVKCRPPQNRAPEPDEVETCSPFLFRQLAVIHPKAIVCLGATAFQSLMASKLSISRLRGQWLDFRGTPMLATYHPAYLLRNPNAKGEVWDDLKKVMAHLGLKPPARR